MIQVKPAADDADDADPKSELLVLKIGLRSIVPLGLTRVPLWKLTKTLESGELFRRINLANR